MHRGIYFEICMFEQQAAQAALVKLRMARGRCEMQAEVKKERLVPSLWVSSRSTQKRSRELVLERSIKVAIAVHGNRTQARVVAKRLKVIVCCIEVIVGESAIIVAVLDTCVEQKSTR